MEVKIKIIKLSIYNLLEVSLQYIESLYPLCVSPYNNLAGCLSYMYALHIQYIYRNDFLPKCS